MPPSATIRRASAAMGESRLQRASMSGAPRRSAVSTSRANASGSTQAGFSASTGTPASSTGAIAAGNSAPVRVTMAMAASSARRISSKPS